MKKFTSFLLAAALVAPMLSAEEVTIELWSQKGSSTDTYGPDKLLGTMKNDITVSNGKYTVANFLGYNKANLTFSINESVKQSGFTPERYAFVVDFPEAPAEGTELADYTNIVKKGNGFGTKFSFVLSLDETTATDDERNKSGIFKGSEAEYILLNPSAWCLNPDALTSTAIVKRSYGVKEGDTYKVYLQTSSPSYFEKIGEEWPAASTGKELQCYVVFTLPKGGSSSIEGIAVDENAPVEYYNIQGVKVENPTSGLYIRRQGSKTEKVIIR